MKNEIGRKLTSLTIMAIMFAGGMAIGVPSFMPEAASDLSSTSGLLTVSTTTLQGVAILEIVVNDPDNSATDSDIAALSASVGGTSYDLTQASNGKWYAYVVDSSQAQLFDADGNGFEFGILCTAGVSIEVSTTDLIVDAVTDVYVAGSIGAGVSTAKGAGGCLDIDNAVTTTDDTAGTTSRQDLTAAVLQGAPSVSNPDGDEANLGQRAHGLNASGYGSWPYVIAVDLNDDNEVAFGSDAINVVYGNTDDETSISLANRNPADRAEIHLTFTDPALNIDPTTADMWSFDLSDNTGGASATSVLFANNGTSAGVIQTLNNALDAEELGQMGCINNCALYSSGEGTLGNGTLGVNSVLMTESGANTGVFESFDINGNGQIETTPGAAADTQTIFYYGGNSVDQIITYNDASISLDAGGDWAPGQSATISVNAPDANRNPTSAETLNAYDETVVIPTIVMGTGGLTLAGGINSALDKADVNEAGGATNLATGVNVGSGNGGQIYTLNVYNTTDNSERLRIIHSAEGSGHAGMTHTWVNVTTGHTRANLIDLAGTVVLNYDIRGAADLLSSTGIKTYVTDSGGNTTNNTGGLITVNTSGNVKSGSYDIAPDTSSGGVINKDVTVAQPFSSVGVASTSLVSVAFKITHAAGNDMASDADYAISADFCNFDQANGSLTHNCIYRLEAVETGDNTGVFEGSVEYINLNNSTANGSISGEHDGGDQEVEGLLGYIRGDALSVVLMDSVSGSDSVRVVYNDTDAFQVATKIGAQLETSTHTGDISLDQGSYGAADIAVITIVDADLNTDSAARDTYQNSSTTFNVTVTQSGQANSEQLVAAAMTIIETGDNTGVFVGTFSVPDYKGSDMELTYYDSRDACGSAVEYYDTATVVSNSGSVSFDRSVYPVPFGMDTVGTTNADLYNGAGTAAGNSESGAVTAWITISDADETNDTLTTSATTYNAGTILIKHVEGTDASTCFTAGGAAAFDAVASTHGAELGPLAEIVIGSSEFEASMSITEQLVCADETVTIQAGDVLQVEYVDTADDAGSSSTFYDSSTFDLRTGTLSVDKDVYVMGSDMVITVTDPDLNLDSSTCESYAMSLIEWDSSADSSQLLNDGFTSNPSSLEETGCDTGVFQTVTTLPVLTVGDGNPEYGEAVTLTYVDSGLSGENDVNADKADIEATLVSPTLVLLSNSTRHSIIGLILST